MPHSRDSRFVRLILISFFLLAILYAGYEARGALYGPSIEVSEEPVSEQFTSIRGRALRMTELRLNGQTINVTEDGDFDEIFLLAPGSNRVILEARDARGRTAVRTLDIVYAPHPETTPESVATTSPAFPRATSSPPATSTLKRL
ncbi:MAG: hypothetical protein WAZ27_01960 [Minisyncoccia bacterium]